MVRAPGMTPPLASREDVLGRKVAIQLKVFKGVGSNPDREYVDVESFLPADAVTTKEKVGA
jgi:hypothetical protein